MGSGRTEDIIKNMVLPVVEELNYELVDVEYTKEGSNWFLRIYIDKEDGISIDDCKNVSEKVSKLLDEKDPVEPSYFLEISSPGLNRPLKKESDFKKYKGENVQLKVYESINGRKEFEGVLEGLVDDIITIVDNGGGRLEFDRKKVAIVKRTVGL